MVKKFRINVCLVIIGLLSVYFFTITAHAEEPSLSYIYQMDNYGFNRVIGFEYLNEIYSFDYDERGIITYICDSEGNKIAYYECDAVGNVTGVYYLDRNEWRLSEDESFVGNINKVRWIGYEYDEVSGCYIIDGRYFDVQKQEYLDGIDNSFALTDKNPFLNENEEGIMLADAESDDLAAEEWKLSLLASSTYGKSISYSDNWYNSLSTVELLARCIYCEGGTVYTTEGDAVAWVILNRFHSSSFPDNFLNIITAANQFSSITGIEDNTRDSRMPSTSSLRWQNATYLACLLLTTTDTSEWASIVGNKINGQLYFYSYTRAKNNGVPFSGTSSNSLYYDNDRITNVYVLGYGSVSSFTTLFANYSPTAYSRNIYYDKY